MSQQQEPTEEGLDFQCKDCGSDRLIVEHTYKSTTSSQAFIPCTCGANREGVAATRDGVMLSDVNDWGYLTDTHEVEGEGHEVESDDPEFSDPEITCEKCYRARNADWQDVEYSTAEEEVEATETDEESEEWTVRCAGCRREIEFGWSHPDRGGRIWPVESSDYNPRLAWPEPRYAE